MSTKKYQMVQEAFNVSPTTYAKHLALFIKYLAVSFKQYSTSKEDIPLSHKMSNILDSEVTVRIMASPSIIVFSNSLLQDHFYISRPTLKLLTSNELVAILLHEAGQSSKIALTVKGGGGAGIIFAVSKLMERLIKTDKLKSKYSKTAFSLLTILLSNILASMGSALISRSVDRFSTSVAVKHGYGKHLVRAYKKIMAYNKQFAVSCNTSQCKTVSKVSSLFNKDAGFKRKIEVTLAKIAKGKVPKK